jgi:DNA-binding MarR family transcriptional regulator
VEILGELARELRQFTGLGTSFFRAVAAKVGMTVTDLQVIDFLDSAGPMTAGQLADLTGLTTGAITGMINRLEEAGLVKRLSDPNDGRRVIVHLVRERDEMHTIDSHFASLERSWEDMASHYDDEQLASLVEFLKQSNMIARNEIVQLQVSPSTSEDMYSAPLGDLQSGRLVVSGPYRLNLRSGGAMDQLYQTRFEGSPPEVKVKGGVVSIRYSRRLWMLGGRRVAEVALNTSIPWQIVIQGGTSEITARLSKLYLDALQVKGGTSTINLDLPTPVGVVPIRISGGASVITVRRPAGVAARAHLKGWASTFVFDDQTFSDVGNDVRLQSQGFEVTTPHYDIEVSSSVSTVTITAG